MLVVKMDSKLGHGHERLITGVSWGGVSPTVKHLIWVGSSEVGGGAGMK